MTPQHCRCGANFTVNHMLSCKQAGWHSIRHDDQRDILTSLLNEVCREVSKEPRLLPLNEEQLLLSANKADNARLDICARGFWIKPQDAFFDVRVFYTFAPSYSNRSLPAIYYQHEQQKHCKYGQRVREVEHRGFMPLVFSTTGGMALEAKFSSCNWQISSLRKEMRASPSSWAACDASPHSAHCSWPCDTSELHTKEKDKALSTAFLRLWQAVTCLCETFSRFDPLSHVL